MPDIEQAFRSYVESHKDSEALKPGEPFSFHITGDSKSGLEERWSTPTPISTEPSRISAATTLSTGHTSANDRQYNLQSFCDLSRDETQVSLHSDLLRVLVMHLQAMYRMKGHWPSQAHETHTDVHVKSTDDTVLGIFVQKNFDQVPKLTLIRVPARQDFNDAGGLSRQNPHFALSQMADKLQQTVFIRMSPDDLLPEIDPLIRDSEKHPEATRSGLLAEVSEVSLLPSP